MNIANNLVAIEEIKSDILGEVADLYKKLADYDELSDYMYDDGVVVLHKEKIKHTLLEVL